ncbi:hypothetical protein EJ06DRAFT_527306 [Trichodelitschia bisporula]|uniref:MARVEL domain-containing protein n=1 Tax=Trichodelitschia bisporula TaxID=703511 RepID=A0A6G1I6T5_9PEZI|nr:hypothetical protein EJ06DRAFT_527306 [Trichodelitschia bisporula]
MSLTPVRTIARILQLLWTVLIIALVGNMIATATAGNPSIVNYDMFVAAFSALSLFYLFPAAFRESFAIPDVVLLLDLANVLFWFCGAVATAAYLGVHSCSSKSYTEHNKVTNGSKDTHKRCTEAQASTAFLWFGFACYVVTLFIAVKARGNINMRGSSVGRSSAMSQV